MRRDDEMRARCVASIDAVKVVVDVAGGSAHGADETAKRLFLAVF